MSLAHDPTSGNLCRCSSVLCLQVTRDSVKLISNKCFDDRVETLGVSGSIRFFSRMLGILMLACSNTVTRPPYSIPQLLPSWAFFVLMPRNLLPVARSHSQCMHPRPSGKRREHIFGVMYTQRLPVSSVNSSGSLMSR